MSEVLPKASAVEPLEPRYLFAFSQYAQLIHQDLALTNFPQATGAGTTVAIIDSGVTSAASSASLRCSVLAGRSGMTNQRICALLSHTLTCFDAGTVTPNSCSTARGSRTPRARNTGSLYQYGGKPSTGHG